MCGYLCIVSNSKNKYKISSELLNHRGPDSTSVINYKNITLQHWRLSIVDLTNKSNQPIEDDRSIFAYNGEVYDYKKIAKNYKLKVKSDTWLVKNILERSNGLNELYQMEGFFSFVSISKATNQLIGARDIFGKKPLYYYIDNDIAIFASEEKAIIPYIKKVKINKKSIAEYLLYKDNFFGKTSFKGIKELVPGSSFFFNVKEWKLSLTETWKNYYEIEFKEKLKTKNNYSLNDNSQSLVGKYIQSATERRLECDVPVQIALSGGIDSALIANFSSKSKNVIRAINVSFDSNLDESSRAEHIANKFELNFKKIKFDISQFENELKQAIIINNAPLAHPHYLAVLMLCKEAQKLGKVLLTGEGADELFFGYNHYENFSGSFAFREYLTYEEENLFIDKKNLSELPFSKIRFDSNIKNLRKVALHSAANSRDLEIKTHLLSLLRRNDRMSMAHSVEIRSPFLDHNLYRYVLNNISSKELIANRKDSLKNLFNQINPGMLTFDKKIGFTIPFDENFHKIMVGSNSKIWLSKALNFLEENLDLKIKDDKKVTPRLGWSLLNIGCFLDSMKNNVYIKK